MINGLSKSIYRGLQSIDNAQNIINRTTKNLATGKTVNSAKDNGAAFTQAAALKSQISQIDGREFIIVAFEATVAAQQAQDENTFATESRMVEIVKTAMSYAAGSDARRALQAEWQTLMDDINTAYAPSPVIVGGQASQADGNWGIRGPSADPLIADTTIWTMAGTPRASALSIDHFATGVASNAIDILNGSNAHLSAGLQNLEHERTTYGTLRDLGKDGRALNWLDRVKAKSDADRNRLELAISSLTDADLGEVSNDMKLAEGRFQIATNLVANAIDHYSNIATSLLGNVSSTQRGIFA